VRSKETIMCDTMYAGPAAAGEGRAWFAKNSDRHPAEPQALCLVPRVEAGFRSAAGAGRGDGAAGPGPGLAFALSKPSWMAGGEMGLNEKGVAIGNEAVFSRFKAHKDGILGMDILRSALATSSTPEEARDYICGLVESQDQGGNGAFKGSLVYSNSFIVAGPGVGYVVETAGRRWAWRSTESIATISNAYSIEEDYKRLDVRTRKEIAPVNERAACSDEADPGRKGHKESWREHVQSRFYLRFTKGDSRRERTTAALRSAAPAVGMAAILGALRDHGAGRPGAAGMAVPCLHEAGFPIKSTSTASMAVEYLPPSPGALALLWFTGCPHPCLSVFVPVLLVSGEFFPLWTGYDYAEGATASYDFWERRRALHRRAGGVRLLGDPAFTGMRDGVQESLRSLAAEAAALAGAAILSGAPPGPALEPARRRVDEAMSSWGGYLEAFQ
jgi:secernin